MAVELLARLVHRYRPRFGWLPFVLLAAALAGLVLSVLDVAWVPLDGVVIWTVALGFLLGALLAQRTVRPAVAWLSLIVAGAALSLALVAELWPPPFVARQGAAEIAAYGARQLALFADRAAGWVTAVAGGGRSTETVVFTLGLALAGWFVAAFLAWSSYRLGRPYWGLTLVGAALAVNTFYGQAPLYWAVLFFGLAVTAATFLNYLHREAEWERAGVDYSAEVRPDLLVYAAGVSLGIMSLAMALPAINFRAIAEAFQRQEAVVAAEQTLERAFAGVQQPRTDEGAIGAGGLPRSFLLGGDPQLAATVVMTAAVALPADLPPGAALTARNWRSVSYDVYTGRGWARSSERDEAVEAGQPIPAAEAAAQITLTQTVDWVHDRRATRYTVGRPALFSHDLTVSWRGSDDLVGVRGRNNAPFRYTAQSTAVLLDPAGLEAARLEDVPAEIRARYTALPRGIPDRVYELARVAAGLEAGDAAPPSPYAQARAIEAFLHQYPYTLDLPQPPRDVDIVDYFLFDLQRGFCDYYASAMVVMARAVGLPARLAAGFLQQPPDARGVQTVRQLDAHSWAEVYFAGIGWVEFEPTAPFAVAAAPAAPAAGDSAPPTFEPPQPMAVVPPRAPQRQTPWFLWLGLAALALVVWQLWGRRALARRRAPRVPLDAVQAAFAGLQDGAAAAGHPYRPGQTPDEFAAALLDQLEGDEAAAPLRGAVARLAGMFAARQYGRRPATEAADEARAAWVEARAPLRRLAWRRRFRIPP
ncbi:MAG: transglutaminase domain-containing protein [Candidatus Promineofilum sp.]|nr:transglutaminase domain-containing protein [Promineifilum sp.]